MAQSVLNTVHYSKYHVFPSLHFKNKHKIGWDFLTKMGEGGVVLRREPGIPKEESMNLFWFTEHAQTHRQNHEQDLGREEI